VFGTQGPEVRILSLRPTPVFFQQPVFRGSP